MKQLTQKEIVAVEQTLSSSGLFIKSPIEYISGFSESILNSGDTPFYLKREDSQPIKSFKGKGAYYAMVGLSETERKNGVVCASAGNHAQGIAAAGAALNTHVTIFMPIGAPDVKVDATRRLGGKWVNIQLKGSSFDETKSASDEFASQSGATYIHPFDDESIIKGTATIGMEIFQQMKKIRKGIDYILTPVGGGGLFAGLIQAKNAFSPDTTIIGIEQKGFPSMKESLDQGRIVTINNPGSSKLADGTAVATPGEITFGIAQRDRALGGKNSHIITVGKHRLAAAIKAIENEYNIILEPSGALGIAAIGQVRSMFKEKSIVVIGTGGNIANVGKERTEKLAGQHRKNRKSL